ncbi:Small ribosomal subunit protein eS4-like protein [Drosera capensis]
MIYIINCTKNTKNPIAVDPNPWKCTIVADKGEKIITVKNKNKKVTSFSLTPRSPGFLSVKRGEAGGRRAIEKTAAAREIEISLSDSTSPAWPHSLRLDPTNQGNRQVLVDGKVRTDKTYPAGFMDIVSIPKPNENFRLLYDTKGRFRLHSMRDEDAKVVSLLGRRGKGCVPSAYKLCQIRSVEFGKEGIPYLNTYDGRTIRYPDPLIKANDTIRLDLETNKITDFIKFDVGNVVMVTGGRNRGRVGVIKNREKHKGSFETIHVTDADGHEFATCQGNVFIIRKGSKPWVSLPKGGASRSPSSRKLRRGRRQKLIALQLRVVIYYL